MQINNISKWAALLLTVSGMAALPLAAGAQEEVILDNDWRYVSDAWAPYRLTVNQSDLYIVGGAITTNFYQQINSNLLIALDNRDSAYLQAGGVYLNNNVLQIVSGSIPLFRASEVAQTQLLISTTGTYGIYGNFESIVLPFYESYISQSAYQQGQNYIYTRQLSWFAENNSHGDFAVHWQSFNLDVTLTDQPTSGTTGAWDGKSLYKYGLDTLTVSASQAYTGTTTVGGGTLLVSGAGNLNSNEAVYATNSGHFRYDGNTSLSTTVVVDGGGFSYNSEASFSGSLVMVSGALGGTNLRGMQLYFTRSDLMLSPGNSVGTVFADDVTFSRAGVFDLEIGGAMLNDKLVTDVLTLTDGGFTILLSNRGFNDFDASQNYSWEFVIYNTLNGNVDANAFVINTNYFFGGIDATKFTVSDSGGKLVLSYQAVPEPSTWALLAIGALLLTTLRRKKHHAS